MKPQSEGLTLESTARAGAYHCISEDPDDRTISACKKHNIQINHTTRRQRNRKKVLQLWGSYLDNKPIADPYCRGMVGNVLEQCRKLSHAFLNDVVSKN